MAGIGLGSALGLTQQPPKKGGVVYKSSSYSANTMLGIELRAALKPSFQKSLSEAPVSLITEVKPYITPVEETYEGVPEPVRMVFISVGFIELMNNVSHAKAIDLIEKGFFRKYLSTLATESGDTSLAYLEGVRSPRFWSDRILNEQLSNYFQMVGMVVAIDLAHLYLGHYRNHRDKLEEDKTLALPINRFLTKDEWERALAFGTWNSLECGFGTEGAKTLFDAIDKMPTRPEWTEYFLPKGLRVSRLKRSLARIERDFFSGKELDA